MPTASARCLPRGEHRTPGSEFGRPGAEGKGTAQVELPLSPPSTATRSVELATRSRSVPEMVHGCRRAGTYPLMPRYSAGERICRVGNGMGDRAREPTQAPGTPAQNSSSSTSFLHRPVAIVTLISGIVGTVIAIVGLAITVMGNDDESNGDGGTGTGVPGTADGTTPATAVEKCIDEHGLSDEYQRDDGITGGILFRQCAWPPPSGADPDGYAEISVSSRAGPGESEAEGMTVADYISSTCRDIELVYLFDNQGTFVPEEPLILSKGEIRRVEGGSVWQPSDDTEAIEFTPRRDQSIVMSNRRYAIDTARCV
jgi:hypothetical protein